MGLSAFNRLREQDGEHKMQGREEAKAKKKAAARIARGELPNPVDTDDPMPSTNRLGDGEPSRAAEEEWLGKHGVEGNDPPTSSEAGDVEEARLTVSQKGRAAPKSETVGKQPDSKKD